MTGEKIRDVPASCVCTWEWRPPGRRWTRIKADPGCPWHQSRAVVTDGRD